MIEPIFYIVHKAKKNITNNLLYLVFFFSNYCEIGSYKNTFFLCPTNVMITASRAKNSKRCVGGLSEISKSEIASN